MLIGKKPGINEMRSYFVTKVTGLIFVTKTRPKSVDTCYM